MHIGAALVFEPLPGGGTPRIDELRDTCARGHLPRFSQRLSSTHAGSLEWLTWEPADTYDLASHVHHATLPAPGGEAELHEWLADFWSHRLDRRRPLWEMTLLDGLEGGRWALATKTHHCLVDGVGSLDIGHVLLDASPDARAAAAAAPRRAATEPGAAGSGSSPGLVARGGARRCRRGAAPARVAASACARRPSWSCATRSSRRRTSSLNGPMSGTRDFATVRLGARRRQGRQGRARRDGQRRRARALHRRRCAICCSSRGEEPPAASLRAQVPVNIRSAGARARARQRADVAVRRAAGRRGGPDRPLPPRRASGRSAEGRLAARGRQDDRRPRGHGAAAGRRPAGALDVRRTACST